MRVFTLILAAASAALFCGAASGAPSAPAAPLSPAAASPAGADASDAVVRVHSAALGRHSMLPADPATLAGAYPLSNGSQLRVSYERQRLFAELGGRRMELIQTGATTFLGRGSPVSFSFDQVPFATDVTVTY